MPCEWSLDYCLTCDREAPQGAAYCSQTCRLADMERASCSSSPKSSASSSTTGAPGGFYLPPALNFSALAKSSASSFGALSSRKTATNSPSWLAPSQSTRHGSLSSGLHPSPSRTSLSSMPSQHSSYETAYYISENTQRELNEYANCFDQVRDWKRRMTVV